MVNRLVLLMLVLWGTWSIDGTAFADWAHKIVVNDGKSYIVTDQQINASQIGTKVAR
ncbi:hypothetical protein [Paenibacillus gansuensis]|uniref:Uncharacterized protein n=1 Tax=Paenibacillus gansuensis TaxID=306542 RepID=A0ABW5P7T9_9BACL